VRVLQSPWRHTAGAFDFAAATVEAREVPHRTQDSFANLLGSYAWVLGALFAAVVLLIAVLLIRYRAGRATAPSPRAGSRLVEGAAVAIFALIAVYLVARTFSVEGREDSLAATSTTVRVDAIAFQWGWEFDYPGTSVRVVGRSGSPPTLVLPAGRTVEVTLQSRDVLHSFWVPVLRYKRVAFPGQSSRFDVVVPLGDHPGSCALFCGVHHAEMRFDVRGVGAQAWKSFIAGGGTA
jgi:cytochrome c oxidase subunit 2